MNKTKRITFCAIMASIASAVMLVAYFPYLTYAVPAIAGLFVMIIVIELGCKWALLSYFASAILTILFAETESKILYICFFGIYPILKCLIEKIAKPYLEMLIKIIVFNICVIGAYFIISKLLMFGYSEIFGNIRYGVFALFLFANIVFIIYDFAISKISVLYFQRFRVHVKKFL